MRVVLWTWLVGAFIVGSPCYAVEIRDVVEAWRNRMNQVRTVRMSWVAESDERAGLRPLSGMPDESRYNVNSGVDLLFDRGVGLWVKEVKPGWDGVEGKYVDGEVIRAQVGGASRAFYAKGRARPYPTGQVVGSVDKFDWMLGTSALRWWCSPFDGTEGGLEADRLEGGVMLDGHELGVVRHVGRAPDLGEFFGDGKSTPGAGGRWTFWVDPARAYVPVKVEAWEGRRRSVLEVSYRWDEKAGVWCPKGWSWSLLGKDGSERMSERAIVTECVVNGSIGRNEFEVEFPRGTMVWNHLDKDYYIIRDDGSIRSIVPGEYKDGNYDELAKSEKGDLLPEGMKPRESWGRAILIGANLAVVAAVLWLFARRRWKGGI